MQKIVILGCENSHANSFLKYINEREEFSDVEVVGVYSDEPEPCEKLKAQFGVNIMKSYDEAVGQVDGVMITARHGDNHFKYAKPYIKSGVPMFIDKPITISEEQAVEFMRELECAGVKITGGSSLRHDANIKQLRLEAENDIDGKTVGGIMRAPLAADSPYGGFFFYAQHLVEMVCEVFGKYPRSVSAFTAEKQTTVVFRYNGFDAVGTFVDGSYIYYAVRLAENGAHAESIKLSADNDWFYNEFSEFYELLRGGEQKISYRDFIAPVFIMNAIKRSVDSGEQQIVKEIAF